MKIGIIVQARMGSSRLPGKVMKEVMGKTLLEHLILRLRQVRRSNEIIIATTTDQKDDVIANLAKSCGVKVFRGSEANVLERYYLAAQKYGIDVIVRITSDCPVTDPSIVDKCIEFFLEHQPVDYVSSGIKRTFPRGIDVEVLSFAALERAFKEAMFDNQKEHVTPYIKENPDKFRIASFEGDSDYSAYRWTVDTAEDLDLIKQIYKKLYPEKPVFHMEDILKLFAREPELENINRHVKQKES